ncbi:hypothetical protein NDU88_002634 [Pleurodeles waltl]|uniref:Uncharacterized protein n=1 Tax=Pleurodeles waltl TaxID=8319 RepID=A0AAV7T475_PLEWA|nr:hypothetical protein NDU88_002634 [Pleurodeles waltl]
MDWSLAVNCRIDTGSNSRQAEGVEPGLRQGKSAVVELRRHDKAVSGGIHLEHPPYYVSIGWGPVSEGESLWGPEEPSEWQSGML